MHPVELRKKLKTLAKQSSNSSSDSFSHKVDVNVRSKRRGTLYPGALLKSCETLPLKFKDASQLPKVGLEAVEEEEKDRKGAGKKGQQSSLTPPKVLKFKHTPQTPMPSSESAMSVEIPRTAATEEAERTSELIKKFDSVQARIKKNLNNIKSQERTRFSIEEPQFQPKEKTCCCESASGSAVKRIMEEISTNKVLHPQLVVDGDVKQLRTEIGQYKSVLRHVGNVSDAVAKTEELMKNERMRGCSGKCCLYSKTGRQKKEIAVQYEREADFGGRFVLFLLTLLLLQMRMRLGMKGKRFCCLLPTFSIRYLLMISKLYTYNKDSRTSSAPTFRGAIVSFVVVAAASWETSANKRVADDVNPNKGYEFTRTTRLIVRDARVKLNSRLLGREILKSKQIVQC